MSEPQRLLQGEGDDLGLALLRSARDDAPTPHARQKTLAALGLSAGAGAAVTTVTATATAGAAVKAGATVGLIKWIGVGVIGGLVTVGAVTVVKAPQTVPIATSVARANPSPPAQGVAVEAPKPAAQPVDEPPPAAAPEPAPKPSAKPAIEVSARPAEKPSLADEVAALDAARVALGSGNAAGALRALDDHDRRFPGGALGPEATVLRIEALAQRGDRASAARLGRAFLAAHPRSPHAPRLRSLIGADEPSPEPPSQ